MAFDVEDHVELINQPLLMMAGSDADTRYMTDDVYKKLTTEDKDLFLLEGASHIDTYWKEPYVTQEIDKLVTFFNRKL